MHILNSHYHVYNRGAHKAPIFLDGSDYERFISLLFISNMDTPLPNKWSRIPIWSIDRKRLLVDIFAYCLMPNHFHLGLIEKSDRGIEKFIRRLITAYATYYNKKYDHSGTIFQGNYKSKFIDTDRYLRYLIQYIHLNPFGIEMPDLMKEAKSEYIDEAIKFSMNYKYSSYKDYLGEFRIERNILTTNIPYP